MAQKKQGALKEIFGQFVTREFWKELAKTVVHEALVTFLIAFGGAIQWYGRSKRNKEVAASTGGFGGAGGGENSNKAFGNGYTPNPSFFNSSGPNYPVNSNPSGDQRYPGF